MGAGDTFQENGEVGLRWNFPFKREIEVCEIPLGFDGRAQSIKRKEVTFLFPVQSHRGNKLLTF